MKAANVSYRFLCLFKSPLLKICLLLLPAYAFADDPLPSWNESKNKQAIIQFVEKTTNKTSKDYLPPEKRIATFDNDGTLWSEKPLYFQLLYVFDRIKKQSSVHPEWKTTEPYASILKGDIATALAGGTPAILELAAATHSGMTVEQFNASVRSWLESARHPTTKLPYQKMVYQPMLELLQYLRANGYKTFIVSGGGIDFMRVFAEEVYGIPPEQVVGTSLKAKYQVQENGPVIVKLPGINFVDDGEGKPVGIYRHIGRRPVFAAGNSDGDFEMLEWTTADAPSMAIYVHHTDAKREWSYDRKSSVGSLNRGLDEAKKRGWLLIDMKKEWKVIYSSAE